MAELAPESPVRENIQRIIASAMRASALTRQMFAYSGRSRFVVKPICLSSLVREIEPLLPKPLALIPQKANDASP